uniref:Uncharacterized protein n=1 Tax=Mycena chlorophos TaxID=658473 RepID=A0ABQ0LWH1_MYCCL|nr:predicted protein [Mycena chlorophos]
MAPAISTLLNTILVALNAANTPTPFDPGFNITAVAATAKSLPSHVWEFGTAIEALLELDTPKYSVFGPSPFPVPTLDPAAVPALAYAQAKIVLGTGAFALDNGDGAAGDPASLGVGATMLGKTNQTFADAAAGEIEYLLSNVPRWVNGAISHRADVAELWADFMYMAPPFIAFYGADSDNATLLETAYIQFELSLELLPFGGSSRTQARYLSGCEDSLPVPAAYAYRSPVFLRGHQPRSCLTILAHGIDLPSLKNAEHPILG